MSKAKPSPKKPVAAAAAPRTSSSASTRSSLLDKGKGEMLFQKKNYVLMGAGLLCMILGFILMSGGSMPSPDVWEKDLIYSFRRTVLAPALVIAGLVIEVVAIFAKTKTVEG